jgi:hypothetical protein
MKMSRINAIWLLPVLTAASCLGRQDTESPHVGQSRQAIMYLLESHPKPSEEITRFRKIVDALVAKGNDIVEVLIRTGGQSSRDQSKGFSLASRQFVALSENERKSAYQFVAVFDPDHTRLTVRVANLHFLFRVEENAVVFEKSETEQITPPPRPGE